MTLARLTADLVESDGMDAILQPSYDPRRYKLNNTTFSNVIVFLPACARQQRQQHNRNRGRRRSRGTSGRRRRRRRWKEENPNKNEQNTPFGLNDPRCTEPGGWGGATFFQFIDRVCKMMESLVIMRTVRCNLSSIFIMYAYIMGVRLG